jgi:hypothetical protein
MSKTMYSVFDTNGFGVTGQLYYQKANAESFALNAALVAEYGPCHAGIPCADHDELEAGLCYHCAALRKPLHDDGVDDDAPVLS